MTKTTMPTIGIDLGDDYSCFCILSSEESDPTDRGRIKMTVAAMQRFLEQQPSSLVVIEAGTHSHWVSQLVLGAGHDLVVANPRKLPLIYKDARKSDEKDAEHLARLGRADPKLLSPVQLRSREAQLVRTLLKARDALVRARTKLVNSVRSLAKVQGERVRKISAEYFHRRAREDLSDELLLIVEPVLTAIEVLSGKIRGYEKQIEKVGQQVYPESALLRQVTGVGALTSVAYVATIEDPARFQKSREVGAYLGLVARRDQSGKSDKQLGITKAGDEFLRRLLVQSAHYILGPFGPDTDLRRWGLALVERGGKAARKRAVVAVARKLAVLLHALWKTGEQYEPLRNAGVPEAA